MTVTSTTILSTTYSTALISIQHSSIDNDTDELCYIDAPSFDGSPNEDSDVVTSISYKRTIL